MNVGVRPLVKGTRMNRVTALDSRRVLLLSSCLLVMMFSWGPSGDAVPGLLALLMAALLTWAALFRSTFVISIAYDGRSGVSSRFCC